MSRHPEPVASPLPTRIDPLAPKSPKETRPDQPDAPVFDLGHCYLADARDMAEVPDHAVNLIVTSPPYFNIKDYSKDGHLRQRHTQSAGQIGDIAEFSAYLDALDAVWKECLRVLAPNGKLIINSPLMPMLKKDLTTHENRHIFDINGSIQQRLLSTFPNLFLMDTYIWARLNPTKSLMFGSYPYPTNFYAQNTSEFVTVYVKAGKRPPVSPDIKEVSKLSQKEWVELTRQIWELPIPNKSDTAFGDHSALMPLELAERCVRLFSFVDDVVLDPFAGSGTTLLAASNNHRRFIGYELVESYGPVINKKLGRRIATKPKRKPQRKSTEASPRPKISSSLLDRVVKANAEPFLRDLPEGAVDLACIDPPYNLGKDDWDAWPTESDYRAFTKSWLNLVWPRVKPGGSLYLFNTPANSAWILEHMTELGAALQNWITWDKRDGFSSTTRRFVPRQEAILFLTKPGDRHFFDADGVRVPYDSTERIEAARNRGILKNGKRWYPNPNGALCGDVWHIPSERHTRKHKGRTPSLGHPTVKPLKMIERIVIASSVPGDIVLDCFAGTGTTAVAAISNGRKFVGCDNNRAFVRMANERIEAIINRAEAS